MKNRIMHNLTKPFPGGKPGNGCCFAWKLLARRHWQLMGRHRAAMREITRLNTVLAQRRALG